MSEESDERQDLLLERIAEDLVRIGEQVAVSPENLIVRVRLRPVFSLVTAAKRQTGLPFRTMIPEIP